MLTSEHTNSILSLATSTGTVHGLKDSTGHVAVVLVALQGCGTSTAVIVMRLHCTCSQGHGHVTVGRHDAVHGTGGAGLLAAISNAGWCRGIDVHMSARGAAAAQYGHHHQDRNNDQDGN